jgi:hypothetical protein
VYSFGDNGYGQLADGLGSSNVPIKLDYVP